MKTPNKNQIKGKLGNRTALITEGSSKKWLLYLTGEKDPLIGFIHADTREEALERLAAFSKKLLTVPAEPPVVEQMTPERITRRFNLFGTIIPASTNDTERTRTLYFYRKQAIAWARMARQHWPTTDFAPMCARLAKAYLTSYRRMKRAA